MNSTTSTTITYEFGPTEAMEETTLPRDAGVTVFVHDEPSEHGGALVTLSAPDRDTLVNYLDEQFAGGPEGDVEWLEWAKSDIREITVPKKIAPEPRTILVHLNVQLPDGEAATVEDVEREVQAALEIAAEGDHAPALASGEWCIADAEEI